MKLITKRVDGYPISIAELRSVTKDLGKLLSPDERDRLVDCLAFGPEAGEIIQDTGGIRKLRWPYKQKGKSKGLRVIYYYHDLNMPLYVLAVYSKGQVVRLTKREEAQMRELVKELVREHAMRTRARMIARGELA